MEEIIRFQKYMNLIRKVVGWSAEEFGERIGVTRQTINNLEKNNREKFKLNKTQYIAMRSVLEAEIASYPEETELLRLMLDMLIDHPEKYKQEDVNELLNKINLITPSIQAGTATRQDASKEIMKGMAGAAIAGGIVAGAMGFAGGPLIGGAMVGNWIYKVIKSGKKR